MRQTYIEIKEESDFLFLEDKHRDLFFIGESTVYPCYIETNGGSWFDAEDLLDTDYNKSILDECKEDVKNSISVQEYVIMKLDGTYKKR